jgi:hypothetical protein
MFVASASAQTSLRDYAGLGCLPIDANKKSIRISYESVGPDSSDPAAKPRPKVWLRLHNNLTCGIRVKTITVTEVTLSDGKVTTEVLQDGARIVVLYQLQDEKRKKVPKAAPEFYGVHVISLPILPPGRSITFGVPLEHFKKRLDVIVPFVYTWEGFDSESLVHQVKFLNEMLPERALE